MQAPELFSNNGELFCEIRIYSLEDECLGGWPEPIPLGTAASVSSIFRQTPVSLSPCGVVNSTVVPSLFPLHAATASGGGPLRLSIPRGPTFPADEAHDETGFRTPASNRANRQQAKNLDMACSLI